MTGRQDGVECSQTDELTDRGLVPIPPMVCAPAHPACCFAAVRAPRRCSLASRVDCKHCRADRSESRILSLRLAPLTLGRR
ncbi:hypothetical protein GN956_G11962 [Arapaima gigas]